MRTLPTTSADTARSRRTWWTDGVTWLLASVLIAAALYGLLSTVRIGWIAQCTSNRWHKTS